MQEGPPNESDRRRHAEYVGRAARTHLEALQTFGMRGWSTKDGTFVSLSEAEAQDCSVGAFERLLRAIDRENEIVLQLVVDNAPDSRNVYRMLRHMFKLCAYDMFRKGGRETPESEFGGSGADSDTDIGASASLFEELLQNYLETNPQADPRELFERRKDLARITGKAIELRLLNLTRQFILLAHLQGREDADIAEDLGLETIQVQRHLYKIREALKKAHEALEQVY